MDWTVLISNVANVTVTAIAPLVLWLLRDVRKEVQDIKDNHLPHIKLELMLLQKAINGEKEKEG